MDTVMEWPSSKKKAEVEAVGIEHRAVHLVWTIL